MAKPSSDLIKAVAVCAELTDTDLSAAAARVMAEDLAEYPEPMVMGALTRCRRELRGKLSIAAIIERLDDGRPGPEQAWGMIPPDENGSVVWTEEMAAAYGVAAPLMAGGERIPARMAFLEAYRTEVQRARTEHRAPRWTPSLGHDKTGREGVLMEAVRLGRLTEQHAVALLPPGSDVVDRVLQIGVAALKQLQAPK